MDIMGKFHVSLLSLVLLFCLQGFCALGVQSKQSTGLHAPWSLWELECWRSGPLAAGSEGADGSWGMGCEDADSAAAGKDVEAALIELAVGASSRRGP